MGGVITQPLTVAPSGVAVGQVLDEANRARSSANIIARLDGPSGSWRPSGYIPIFRSS